MSGGAPVPTSYEGREDEHDLGDGHSFVWLEDGESQTIGLIEHHPKGPSGSRVFAAWKRSGWSGYTLTDSHGRKARVRVCVKCRNLRGERPAARDRLFHVRGR